MLPIQYGTSQEQERKKELQFPMVDTYIIAVHTNNVTF